MKLVRLRAGLLGVLFVFTLLSLPGCEYQGIPASAGTATPPLQTPTPAPTHENHTQPGPSPTPSPVEPSPTPALATPTPTPTGSSSTPTPSSPTPEPAIEVVIALKDFALEPDQVTAKAGKITFIIKNQGRYTHDFRVEGQGIDEKSPKIAAGREGRWEITLEPGEYRISCPISNHDERGMVGTLVVVE